MKKTLSLLTAFILLFELTYSAATVESKASYVAGSMGIDINTRGTLQVGEEALIYIYRGNRHEIPYEQITQLQYSKKKKVFDYHSLKPDPPGVSFRYYREADLEIPGAILAVVIVAVIAVGVLIFQLIRISKCVYLNVVYEEDGKTGWATFKIKTDDLQKILLTLSSKSGIEIWER